MGCVHTWRILGCIELNCMLYACIILRHPHYGMYEFVHLSIYSTIISIDNQFREHHYLLCYSYHACMSHAYTLYYFRVYTRHACSMHVTGTLACAKCIITCTLPYSNIHIIKTLMLHVPDMYLTVMLH